VPLSGGRSAEHAEVVIVMVASDQQVEEVVAASPACLIALSPVPVICIASSCAPETCRHHGGESPPPHGIGVLDCPVGARTGGGQQRHRDVLCRRRGALARPRPAGAGSVQRPRAPPWSPQARVQIAKTINNMLLWACMAANFESLSLAKRLGAGHPALIEALGHGSGANWSLSRWGKRHW
jgi:3-hydroxyisobutyrate dehydrogenase-like beta-hydroxyacid dehydrogenase